MVPSPLRLLIVGSNPTLTTNFKKNKNEKIPIITYGVSRYTNILFYPTTWVQLQKTF
jgi:hypothetical protein